MKHRYFFSDVKTFLMNLENISPSSNLFGRIELLLVQIRCNNSILFSLQPKTTSVVVAPWASREVRVYMAYFLLHVIKQSILNLFWPVRWCNLPSFQKRVPGTDVKETDRRRVVYADDLSRWKTHCLAFSKVFSQARLGSEPEIFFLLSLSLSYSGTPASDFCPNCHRILLQNRTLNSDV